MGSRGMASSKGITEEPPQTPWMLVTGIAERLLT